jgi:hypothetical protein
MGKKGSILVKLPMQLYVSLHDRQLSNHISFLVSRLLEEFLKATDVRISWAEMPSKAEQREYLERKLKEFFSQTGQSTEPPKPSVHESTKPTYIQERPKDVFESAKPEPIKGERTAPPKEDLELDEEVLKRIENLW